MSISIGVIGSAVAAGKDYKTAEIVGSEIAKKGAVLVCGGLGGIMEAACKGARENGGTIVGILPGNERHSANPYVDIPIVTGMGEARNVIVVRSSQALIAVSGGWGTLSEISFALKLNIPVIGINTWDVSSDIQSVSDPVEAVNTAYNLALEQEKKDKP